MFTKGSFTHDEWNHLPSLLNIMNFPMSSCRHFLSNRKQGLVSKRAKEGSAVAKPRPMHLVSGNLRAQRKPLRKIRLLRKALMNQELDQSYVSLRVRKLMRNSNQDPTARSQERRLDDTPSSNTRKPVRSGESANSGSTRKPLRGIDCKHERTRLECHNMQISDYRHVEKVFRNFRQKFTVSEDAQEPVLKTNVLKLGIIYVNNDESLCSSWTKLQCKIWKYTGVPTSNSSRICLISPKDWYWNMRPKFWMYLRLIGKILHARDLR